MMSGVDSSGFVAAPELRRDWQLEIGNGRSSGVRMDSTDLKVYESIQINQRRIEASK